jgi:hypothetical protein
MKNLDKTIINLTAHDIKILDPEHSTVKRLASNGSVRLTKNIKITHKINNIPIIRTEYEDPAMLPDVKENTYYIVPSVVAQAYPERKDFLVPSQLVRTDEGKVIGSRGLSVNPY